MRAGIKILQVVGHDMSMKIIKTLLALLVMALVTKPMAYWAMRRLAKSTETLTDDYAVELVIALAENDIEGVQEQVKALADKYLPK